MALMEEEEDLSWMIKQAKEELQILEAHHPNRFGFLKMELRNLIHRETDTSSPQYFPNSFLSYWEDYYFSSMPSSSATTQASSNGKRRKVSEIRNPEANPQSTKQKFQRPNHWMERVDAAVERAEACLQKVQEIKRSFATESDN